MKPIIKLEHIWANYGKRDVLKDVSLEVEECDFLGVIGPNGGGKTTLMKIIIGLLKPEKGSVIYFQDGQETGKINIGYLPQYSHIDKKFPISVKEVILSGLAHRKSLFQAYSSKDFQRVKEVIEQLGLIGLEERQIGQLSGGQIQRVFLGRAIVGNPKVIILDEPSTYLDREGEEKLYDILQGINHNTAIILVSHNQTAVEHFAKHTVYVSETLEMINKSKE